MSIGSILKTGTQHIGRQIGRQLALQSKTLAPAQLTHLNAPERDQFEALLHHHHKALDQATLQDRSAYLEALQHTDLRTYQDYLERKALQFLTEAGVRPSILQHELREELLYADHIRNNYTYFEQQHQQWQKLAGQSTKKPSTALVQLENEAHAFLAVDRSLLNIPAVPAPKKLPAPAQAESNNPALHPTPSLRRLGSRKPTQVLRTTTKPSPSAIPTVASQTNTLPKPHQNAATIAQTRPQTGPEATSAPITPTGRESQRPPEPAAAITRTDQPPTASTKLTEVGTHHNRLNGTRLNLNQLFGPSIKTVRFNQHSGNTCYFLALLDNILQHPQGARLLESIQVTPISGGYRVKFPAQNNAVELLNNELSKATAARPHNPAHIGIPLLEQAYLKLPGVNANDIGESLNVVNHVFPENLLPNAYPFNWNLSNPAQNIQALTPAQYKAQLQRLIQAVQSNTEELPLMTALKSDHISSVRLPESSATHIQLLDPISGPKRLPIDDFIQQYQLIGFGRAETDAIRAVREQLETNLAQQLETQSRQAQADPENLRTFKNLILNDMNLLNRCYQVAPEVVNSALDLP